MRRIFLWLGRQLRQRLLSAMLFFASRRAINTILRQGGRSAVDSTLGAAIDAVPLVGQQSYTQVFKVTPPLTVYVRASHCRVTVRRTTEPKVTLETSTARTFGLELAAEQDEAGIYIIARRKNIVGQIARVEFGLTVPQDCFLAFNLTPGDVLLQDVDGLLDLPPSSNSDGPQPSPNRS